MVTGRAGAGGVSGKEAPARGVGRRAGDDGFRDRDGAPVGPWVPEAKRLKSPVHQAGVPYPIPFKRLVPAGPAGAWESRKAARPGEPSRGRLPGREAPAQAAGRA